MELLREIYEKNIGETSDNKPTAYKLRKAARTIVFNELGQIALMYVSKDKYHKLSGGGVEEDEDIVEALNREVLEEVGVESYVLGEVGIIIEYRDKHELLQISYCYYSKAKGESRELSLTQEEIENGFELKWVDFNEAVHILENDKPTSYVGKFIRERDLTFLRKAEEMNIKSKV